MKGRKMQRNGNKKTEEILEDRQKGTIKNEGYKERRIKEGMEIKMKYSMETRKMKAMKKRRKIKGITKQVVERKR
jgi:hypothetical protein